MMISSNLVQASNAEYSGFRAGLSPMPRMELAGELWFYCSLKETGTMASTKSITVPTPTRDRIIKRTRKPHVENKGIRPMLEQAATRVLPSLEADTSLKVLAETFFRKQEAEETGQTDLIYEIDAHIARVVTDFLKRAGLKWIHVDARSTPEDDRIFSIIKLKVWGREARRKLEIKL